MPPHQPRIQPDQHRDRQRLRGRGAHRRPLVLAVLEDHFRQELAAIVARPQPQVELPVLAQHAEAVVVAAGIHDDLLAQQRGRADEVRLGELARIEGLGGEHARLDAEILHLAIHIADVRRGIAQPRQHVLDRGRHQAVVGVEEHHILAARQAERVVARDADAGVLLGEDGDRVAAGNLHAVVGGAVVDEQNLAILPGLRQRGFDRLGQVPPVVVVGDDDRDERVHGRLGGLGQAWRISRSTWAIARLE